MIFLLIGGTPMTSHIHPLRSVKPQDENSKKTKQGGGGGAHSYKTRIHNRNEGGNTSCDENKRAPSTAVATWCESLEIDIIKEV